MLRRGKSEGWLSLPPSSFRQWAALNDVKFSCIEPGTIEGRGAALIASSDLVANEQQPNDTRPLMTVPKDLILGLERIQEHAKADADFRHVLESIGDFGKTPRGAILTFLLVQAGMSCPDLRGKFGVHTAFIDYIRSLPFELLSIFWSESELELLLGTTLAPAVSSKLKSLRREYDHLCASASETRWYQHVAEYLKFDDWLLVDAMYRSRALEYPGIGHCMVPCVDLANHASGEATIAIYEKDDEDNAVLLLRDGKTVQKREEVTITYGDEKGACEMLFSYGFLEQSMQSAESLFLSLGIPDDDPQASAKAQIADCAPGFKLTAASGGQIQWSGDYVWLLCVNEDDGLRFELARTTDGDVEMHGFLNDVELTSGASQLHSLLGQSELWDVYRLRAITVLQQRIFDQMQVLYGSQDDTEAISHGDGTDVRDVVFQQAMRLRELEFGLMEIAYEQFETEKLELAESAVVQSYLAEINAESSATEDFS